MEDISKELLTSIQEDFERNFNKSKAISELYEKVRDGTATYIEANDFALEVGKILAQAYKNNLSSDILPNGHMYYNIAEKIIPPTVTNNYDLIAQVASQIQKTLNESANIHIKAIWPELNTDRINGIVNKLDSVEKYDDVAWVLDEPIKNFSQSIVDDFIRENVEFQAKAGMQPKVTRKLMGGCCDWCRALAGTYTYPDVPKDVYRRHQRCRCTVEYNPGDGKVQNVHSKQWRDETIYEKIKIRKMVGLETESNFQKTAYRKYVGMYNLSYAESRALINYISPDSYTLNDKLRRGDSLTDREKEWIIELNKALDKLPTYEGDLNRSLIFKYSEDAEKLFMEMAIGSEYVPKQYLSATKQGIYDENAQIQIYIQNSKKGRDLTGFNDMEHEVLYPIGSKFKVVNKAEANGKYYILLEEN